MESTTSPPPTVYISVKPPHPQVTISPKILGPFEVLLRYSGLDLSRSSITASGSWTRTIFVITLCFLICLVMFLKCVLISMETVKPMTAEWAVSCVWCFMAIHGFASALCVTCWTRTCLLPTLQDSLAKFQTQRGAQTCDPSSVYLRIFIFGTPFISTWILASMKGILYDGRQSNETIAFAISYPITVTTMYGFEPIVFLMIGFSSTLAMIIHVLVYVRVNHEWSSYNEELTNSSKLQQLTIPEILIAFSTRQSELLKMSKYVSERMGVFVTLSTIFASLALIDAFYLTLGIPDISFIMRIVAGLWMNCAIGMVLVTLKQPSATQYEIDNTAQILLADEFLQNAQDEKCWRTSRFMIDRARHYSTKMYFMQAFAIDQHFLHKVLFVVPNVGALMVLFKKMGII